MAENEVITSCKKFLQAAENDLIISQAFLFGSHAKGKANESSDIDLALVIKDLTDPLAIQLSLMKLRRKFDIRIEPHPIREEDFNLLNPFANEILKTGISLKNQE